MPFVPMVHTPEQPSMQAIELSQRLQQTIAEYQQRNPSLTSEEIRQAAELAAGQAGGHASPARQLTALIAGGVAVLVLGVGLWSRSNPDVAGAPMVPLAIIAAIAAVMIAVIRLRRS